VVPKAGALRVDFAGEFNGEQVTLRFFSGPGYPGDDFAYVCEPVGEECRKFEKDVNPFQGDIIFGEAVLYSQLSRLINNEERGLRFVSPTFTEEILGEEASCYESGGEGPGSATCLAADGIMLRTSGAEVIQLSRQVDDAALEVPDPNAPFPEDVENE